MLSAPLPAPHPLSVARRLFWVFAHSKKLHRLTTCSGGAAKGEVGKNRSTSAKTNPNIYPKGTQFPYFYRFLISGACNLMKINMESD
jgi:hypothetical protein|tara:strand:- start:569 stop:829 length:261 start_codon:yes stop_codon:yes gene_type:complete